MVGRALRQQADRLTTAVEMAASALNDGGRIIYLGAGTSGRLGVLDASECPPTFGVDPDRVVGIMAGGDRALRESVEGAEDDGAQGVADLFARTPDPRDLIVGIAASGTTPYVQSALDAAREKGLKTVLLCCNPQISDHAADLCITLPTGAEALPGSTRLNAGTATKVALNIISTGAMALAGYVYGGQMVCMRPTNAKLRRRAERMLAALARVTDDQSRTALIAADYRIPVALTALRLNLSPAEAERRVVEAGTRWRDLLREDDPPCS
jgi:N-acetylmuramic acid 6-phosphate etherase